MTDAASMDAVFDTLAKTWGRLDFVVHAIAFSDKNELDGRYVDTTAKNFTQSLLISCYSFTALAKRAEKLMTDGGSMLTLTYYGAEKVMPHYNVMGVAKAALEASVRYLAVDLGQNKHPRQRDFGGPDQDARSVGHRRLPLHPAVERVQLCAAPQRHDRRCRRGGIYLLSDLSRGVTGEIHHVDSGYHVQGMKNEDAPDISVVKSDDS